ncbi:M13 family metallopeptidase, partial [Desulfosarcina sp.]|nr:M13 family metallopeptidase [Desulfosarcina sp.]
FVITACKNTEKEKIVQTEIVPAINLKFMDTTINPKDDFYNYVNGNWMKAMTIPDDEVEWGGFGLLNKTTRVDVLEILKSSKESGAYADGTDQQKAILLFDSELDTIARNNAGIEPLKPLLKAIDGITNLEDMQTVYATVNGVGAPFIGFGAGPDLNDSSINIAYVSPGGVGLQRDYYLEQDDKTKEIRSAYVDHMARMFQYIEYDEAKAQVAAKKILTLETQLVESRLDKVQRRDARIRNNPRSINELQEMTPSINWVKFVSDVGIQKELDTVLVTELKYMEALNTFLVSTNIEDIKTLMTWNTLRGTAGFLTTEISNANWEFYGKILTGAKARRKAEERALGTVNGSLGEAVGKLYVDAKFPPEAKEKAEKMIANIILAFKNRITVLDWMSEETKLKAIEKLDKFSVKIAYPDKWEDYSELKIEASNSFAENMLAVSDWSLKKNYSEINEPVDKTKWFLAPQVVNAGYIPQFNEIIFPAAILQPPFFNNDADDAVNYGAIGAGISHEISHAFDDSGARFDSDGNVNNWWTPEDLAEFEKRGAALAEQYDTIEVLDSVYVNGKFTLGENIGDLGGVLGAYDGLQLSFEENGRPEDIDGFTAEQRFFISFGTIWRTLIREDALRNRIVTDPHSPSKVRATQSLKNIDAFYEAFDIKEGDKMYLEQDKRVKIW